MLITVEIINQRSNRTKWYVHFTSKWTPKTKVYAIYRGFNDPFLVWYRTFTTAAKEAHDTVKVTLTQSRSIIVFYEASFEFKISFPNKVR